MAFVPRTAYRNDFRFWPDHETLTLRTSRPRNEITHDTCRYVRREEPDHQVHSLAGVSVLADRMVFRIPKHFVTNASGIVPGDRLYESDEQPMAGDTTVWIVDSVVTARFLSEYVLSAYRLAFLDSVDVLDQTIAKDDEAIAGETDATVGVRLSAFVMTATAQQLDQFFQEQADVSHLVAFASDPNLTTQHVLLHRDTRRLNVQGVAVDLDSLGKVWVVPCLENR